MTREPVGLVSEAMVKRGWIPTGPWSWMGSLRNGAVLPALARLDEGWLRVEVEMAGLPKTSPWELLLAGSSLPQRVSLALASRAPHATSVRLVADLDTEDGEGWPARILDVSEDLTTAASRLHGSALDAPEPEAPPPESIAEMIRGAGWSCEARGEHGFEIAIDGDGVGARAHLVARGGGLRLFAPLKKNAEAGGDQCADATALFLLLASHRLRAVRAVARCEPGRPETAVGWETALPVEPRAEQLDRALHALAVACRHSLREVQALATPALFRNYLNQRNGGSRERAPHTAARASR